MSDSTLAGPPLTRQPASAPPAATSTLPFGVTDLLLLLMAVIWGANYTAVKYAGLAFSPVSFTCLRVTLAMLTLLGVAAVDRKPWPARRDVLRLLGLGVLGNGIYQLLFVSGVARTRVADAALILAAAPAFIAILSRIRGVERVPARAVAGIVLSITGVGVVLFGSTGAAHGSRTFIGSLLVFCAVLCWSVFNVAVQPLTRRINPVQLNGITMAGGALPLLVFLPMVIRDTPWAHVSPTAWMALVYSAVISLGVAYLFWYRGVRVLGPTRASVYGNLQPIIAILVGWMLLGEAPTVWQLVGTATILSGIFLARV